MRFSNKGLFFRVGIVVLAAVLVEIISVLQYERVRKMMMEEMNARSQAILGSMTKEVVHILHITETTMKENIWEVRRSLAHPDSTYRSMVRLIDDNPHVTGGCLAFVPYYYPSKGRLYEPYAKKEGNSIVQQQLAGPDHDYTQHEAYMRVMQSCLPLWSEPYVYGPDSLEFITYSAPVWDSKGRLAAVCGLDVDLSWVGDTLNSHHLFPSSFSLLLTKDGELVAYPPESRTPWHEVERVVDMLNGKIPQDPALSIRRFPMERAPYWQLVQVFQTDVVYARVRRMRYQNVAFIFLALAILAFMINRYTRNERKLHQASEEQARINGELSVANHIQQEMLPKSFPPYVYGSLEPAREVGGDLFDCFTRDGKLFFCIGDVSGKGVPAAMMMSMIHSLFRVLSQKMACPSQLLSVLNSELCRGNEANMFVTFLLGTLDLYSGVLTFSNAGHDKPFVLTDRIEILPTKANLPLGVFPTTNFEEQTCVLTPGTTLLLYTDGLTEAKNVDRKQFGREGVKNVLSSYMANQDQSLKHLVNSLSQAAHHFAGQAPQSDDLTMLAIRFLPENIIRDQITLQNTTAEVNRLSAFVKSYFDKLSIDKKLAAGLRLGLEETVVNVIDYAYPNGEEGTVSILAESNLKEVRFTVSDSGTPFDPTTVLEADTTQDAQNRPIGGLGILLARRLTDSISYVRRDGKNILTLTKSIL